MRNFKIILVLFLIVSQTLQSQEVEKKQKKTVVKKELYKRDVEKKKTEVPSNKVALKKKSRKREHPASDSIADVILPNKIYPNQFKHITTYPRNSHLGEIDSEGIQGLAHSPLNWFWTRTSFTTTRYGWEDRSYLYKTRLNHMSRKVKKVGVPSKIWKRGWHHLSDPDFYKGYLYVPIEKGQHKIPKRSSSIPPLILLYDEDLNFLDSAPLSFHKDGENIHSGGGWCAINPTDGLLYVSRGTGDGNGPESEYSILDVYDPIIDLNTEKKSAVFRLFYRHSVKLYFETNWKMRTYIQGGVFSPDGLFYYVMDPNNKKSFHSQSGVHVFKIDGEIGTEIIIKDQENDDLNHIRIRYQGHIADKNGPTYVSPELEGLDFVSPDEWIYKVLLMQRREIDLPSLINDTEGITTGFLLLTGLLNIYPGKDEIDLFHYQLINKANPE